MSKEENVLKAIEANIKIIDSSDDYVVMHDYDIEAITLAGEKDVEGLQELLKKTEDDIARINTNSTIN